MPLKAWFSIRSFVTSKQEHPMAMFISRGRDMSYPGCVSAPGTPSEPVFPIPWSLF